MYPEQSWLLRSSRHTPLEMQQDTCLGVAANHEFLKRPGLPVSS
jgi:hypothetical protein